MSKRTSSTEYLFLVVAIRRTETDDPSPSSSSFPAAPAVAEKPGLARTQPTSGEMFPWARTGGGK
jgi:hypothetical protein